MPEGHTEYESWPITYEMLGRNIQKLIKSLIDPAIGFNPNYFAVRGNVYFLYQGERELCFYLISDEDGLDGTSVIVFSNIGNAGYFSKLQDVENKYYANGIIEELIELKWYLPCK